MKRPSLSWRTKAPKIGYIDSGVLLEKYSGAINARKQVQEQTAVWQKNVNTLELELSQLSRELSDNNLSGSEESNSAKRKELEAKQEELIRYRQSVPQKSVELEQQLMQTVLRTLNTYISDFGAQQNYDLILDPAVGGNILYADKAQDVTQEFLTYVKDRE
jgi:outer membrane protein